MFETDRFKFFDSVTPPLGSGLTYINDLTRPQEFQNSHTLKFLYFTLFSSVMTFKELKYSIFTGIYKYIF